MSMFSCLQRIFICPVFGEKSFHSVPQGHGSWPTGKCATQKMGMASLFPLFPSSVGLAATGLRRGIT